MPWIELSVEVFPEVADAVANVLRSIAGPHVGVEWPPVVGDGVKGVPVVEAYIAMDGAASETEERARWALDALRPSYVAVLGPTRRREVADGGDWHEQLFPIRAGRFVIKAPWRSWEAEPNTLVIGIDPGTAFGAGCHPTTRLVLAALEDHLPDTARTLDLGTGSGILALAAARLGARVTALDIAEDAVEIARANATGNGFDDRIDVRLGSIEEEDGPYDAILANILAPILIELAPRITAALAPGGVLLLSGIRIDAAADVRAAYQALGLTAIAESTEGSWQLIVMRHVLRRTFVNSRSVHDRPVVSQFIASVNLTNGRTTEYRRSPLPLSKGRPGTRRGLAVTLAINCETTGLGCSR